VRHAAITFYGSFADTWKGHGTDKAIVSGLLGLPMDSPVIRTSITEAGRRGLVYEIFTGEDSRFHPNTVTIEAESEKGRVKIRASSVGGGNIRLDTMDGYDLGVSCALPTLIVLHNDHPGAVATMTATLSQSGYNIAAMKVSRSRRGGNAIAVIETDGIVDEITRSAIAGLSGIDKVIHISQG
jgi:L-serine dehydratase